MLVKEAKESLIMTRLHFKGYCEGEINIFKKLDYQAIKELSKDIDTANTDLDDSISKESSETLDKICNTLDRISENVKTLFEVPDLYKKDYPSHEKYLEIIVSGLSNEVNRLNDLDENEEF